MIPRPTNLQFGFLIAGFLLIALALFMSGVRNPKVRRVRTILLVVGFCLAAGPFVIEALL